ncbi:hypothetical protein IRT44_06655 [Anoxybacillus sediminis]|jgi:hypothetical protein|nr:hypothetical protein [Brevibacillus sp. NL20B1]UFJ62459.1 hypothetical protein IRT44_06655 [Anoxybacillus sediminis]
MDDLAGDTEGHHAGDAYVCCDESEKTGDLAVEEGSTSRSRQVGWLDFHLFNGKTPTALERMWEFVFNLKPCLWHGFFL